MKAKKKSQASPSHIFKQHFHHRQRAGDVKREEASLRSVSTNLRDTGVLKKSLNKNVSGEEGKSPRCSKTLSFPDADESHKSLLDADDADQVERSGRTAALKESSQPILLTSGAHQHALSIPEAIGKLLLAVKDLFTQHCMLEMMKVNIQFSTLPGVSFQPKQEDWPELQKHIQLLQLCLLDLQSLVDSQQPAVALRSSTPEGYDAEQPSTAIARPASGKSATCCDPAECDLSLPSPSPPTLEDQDQGKEEEEAASGRTVAEETAVDSVGPAPADARRVPQRADRPRPFVCTNSGCEQKPGVSRRFVSEKSLRMHQAACHGRKATGRRYYEYTCPLCRSVQKRPRDLAAHIVTCQGKGEVRPLAVLADGANEPSSDGSPPFIMCRLCHLCFPTGDLLRAHTCQYADTGGVIQELLGTGTLSVSGSELAALRRFICHQCREEFRNQAIYRVHMQFCQLPPYSCELCDAELPCGRQLVLHKMSEHRDLNQPMFFCRAAGCGLSFRLNAALQKHLVQRHSSQPTGQPHGCDVCDKKFIKKIYLTHHKLRYHHDTLRRDFVCDVCGARLGSSSALSVHVRSVHTRPEHTCDVCGKVFSRQDRLAIHAKIHTGVKPYKCSLCPKAFIQQCKLNEHLRRHRGERRFRCVMCDKMYAASHDLRSHLRRIHNVDMVNKTHTIQPAASLLRSLPPLEPEPEPEPELEPEPEPELEPTVQEPERTHQLSTVVPQAVQSLQLHPVQVAAPAQTLHVQDLSQLGGGLILIPAVDASGGTSFYPIINQ